VRFSFWPMTCRTWDDLLPTCRHAEATGWDGIWYADHFMPNQPNRGIATAECWTTVTTLGALVPRLRVGTLVCGNTYRHPAVLAKMAAQADIVSGGRTVLGIGAGWQENEHQAYGIPFYTAPERLRRLNEACAVIQGLLTNERTTFTGKYYQLEDAPLEPKPLQHPLPLLIGGGGEKVTLRIVARHANEWNTWGTPETVRRKIGLLNGYCAEQGRDAGAIRHSAQAVFFLDGDAAAIEAARATGRFPVIAGNADELCRVVEEYASAGLDELVVPDLGLGGGPQKLATLDRFMSEIAPAFR
jgi:F420-dependent oxidoreductase-like protein